MLNPILPGDPAFPPELLPLCRRKPPVCRKLYVRGSWPPPSGIAVVGTRNPTPEALSFTRALAAGIVRAGWAVWSGGARGIDAAAHEAALDLGGKTVVVTPSGFDEPYPPEHKPLFERAASSGGTLVTPFPEDARPTLGGFHQRNAVLAALTLATVVVQAGIKSGARSTANAARKLSRPLFVVPHAPWDPRGEGCARELEAGATAVALVHSFITKIRRTTRAARFEDAAPPLVVAPAHAGGQLALSIDANDRSRTQNHHRALAHDRARVAPILDPVASRIFDAIGETPTHTDDLCERTTLPFATVTAALLTLTLQAVVVEAPAGFYRRNPQ